MFTEDFQLTKLTSKTVDVISVYMSDRAISSEVIESVFDIVDFKKTTILCGDFNICYSQRRNHPIFSSLEKYGFKQLVSESTHIQGGHIDQVHVREADSILRVDVELYSPYYTAKDHDALLINLTFS